jgi:hypothetical protein
METTKASFIEKQMVLIAKEFWKHLPEKASVTKMLHASGVIVNNLNTHLIAAIYQNMKEGK